MWVGGCVTAPVAWASGPSALASRGPWGRRRRGTRGPRPVARATVGTQECTQTGENALSTQPPPACRTRPLVRPTRKMRLLVRPACRMRLCVRWLHVCAGEEKRTLRKSAFWTGDVTEKRILDGRCHGKVHSAREPSRKGALWATARTQSALFRESDTPRVRLSVSRRAQSGALAYTVATRFTEASTHANPRRGLE